MVAPVDIKKLKDWEIYFEDASWPVARNHRFIVAAAVDLLWTRFGLRSRDVAFDHDTEGYRNTVASDLADLLMSGSLIAHAQPVGDERIALIPASEWTPTSAFDAVRRGLMYRRHGSAKAHRHWVFVGSREAQLMEQVYRATDMLQPPEDRRPLEDLGGVILGSLSAIARNPAAIPPEHSALGVVRLLLPNSDWALHPDDRSKLVEAAVPWLLAQFAGDVENRKDRQAFEDQAVAAFAPYMTKRLFDQVWKKLRTSVVPKKGQSAKICNGGLSLTGARALSDADPDLRVHQHYFMPGRRAKSGASSATGANTH